MTKRPVHDLHSRQSNPPRLFDVIIEDGVVHLELKTNKKSKYWRVLWDDVVFQVEAAKKTTTQ